VAALVLLGVISLWLIHRRISGLQWDDDLAEALIRKMMEEFETNLTWADSVMVLHRHLYSGVAGAFATVTGGCLALIQSCRASSRTALRARNCAHVGATFGVSSKRQKFWAMGKFGRNLGAKPPFFMPK
jgi:hypothetical protein